MDLDTCSPNDGDSEKDLCMPMHRKYFRVSILGAVTSLIELSDVLGRLFVEVIHELWRPLTGNPFENGSSVNPS